MLLQVHDELIFEVEDEAVDAAMPVIVDIMENAAMPAVSMRVPLKVDARAADSWDGRTENSRPGRNHNNGAQTASQEYEIWLSPPSTAMSSITS